MPTGKKLIDEVNGYVPNYGEASFWWIGQLGYIVKTNKATILLDPYLSPDKSRLIPPLFHPLDFSSVDYVFGSHNHGDHIDSFAFPLLASASKNAMFIVPKLFVAELAKKYKIKKERFIGMNEGTSYSDPDKDISITAIASAHEFLDMDKDTGLYPSLGYIVKAGGVSFYHSGDTCKYDGLEKKLLDNSPLNLMFVPINGRDGKKYRSGIIGNMDFREAVDLCGMVNPALAVPGHFDMFENNSANPMDFLDFMEAKYQDQAVWIGAHGVRVNF